MAPCTKGMVPMKQNQNSSIVLSQICVILFALLLLTLDLGGWWLARWFVTLRGMPAQTHKYLLCSLYACSPAAWAALWGLWRLLCNLKDNRVFEAENVRIMSIISDACVAAAVICLVSSTYYLAFLVLALAAVFMALIVRIVRGAFRQAIEMRSELDLTI